MRETLQGHLSESTEHRQQTAVQLALLRADLQEHRAQQAEAQLRQAEAVRSLALRTGTVSAVGAGSVAALLPALQYLAHAVGWL